MSAIDPSRLPAPAVVEQVSYEAVLAATLADLQAREPGIDLTPSDPAYKVLEAAAYRETNLRADFNDRAAALLLALSRGADLDHIGVTYYHTQRLVLDAGDPLAVPPVEPTYESDDNYRARLLLAEDGYSTAGPEAAYIYHAKSAAADVKDISVIVPRFDRLVLSPEQEAALPAGAQVYVVVDDAGLPDPTPASVVVSVLSHTGDGSADPELLATVEAGLGDDVRPMTDEVIVQSAGIINYTVSAVLTVYPGFNEDYIRSTAESSLTAWVALQHRIGRDITVAGIHAALMVEGVHNITLQDRANGTDLVADLVVSNIEAPYCAGLDITVGGTGG
jgi:phage-related baseplate assembly protein